MNIGIITYDRPHKKSQDLIHGFISRNFKINKIIVTKFKSFKKKFTPLYSHRPNQFVDISTIEVAKKNGIKVVDIDTKNPYKDCDVVIIGGSRILKKKYIENNLIINCHSGLIPAVRGLDSFKWALYNNDPIGNTLHAINNETDLGKILHQLHTPIYQNDNFFSLANRHYQNEVNLLLNFEKYLSNDLKNNLEIKEPTLRMPKNIEVNLLEYFKKYKENNLNINKSLEKNNEKQINIKYGSVVNITYGKNCKIIHPVNLFECHLADNVFIGPFTEIQKDVKIGKNTKISSHSFVCELVTIGENCFIGHGVCFINDTFSNYKLGGGISKWKKTKIENNVLIGSNSTLLPVNVCSNVVIGAGSVVTKDITKPGKYAGNPAKLID